MGTKAGGVMVPTVHMNGTSGAELAEQLETAVTALRRARECLGDAAPNGRDYYPQYPDAILVATRDHNARLTRLYEVEAELMTIYESVVEQNEKRG